MAVTVVLFVTLMSVVAVAVVLVVIVAHLPIARHIDIVVPIVTNEVDLSSTGMVFSAMLAPMLFVTRRDMQIDGSRGDNHGFRLNDNRVRVYQYRRRKIADGDLAVESGLPHTDGHRGIGR